MSRRNFSAEETKFYLAAIEKENKQRLEWFAKHGGSIIERLQETLNVEVQQKETKKKGKGREVKLEVEDLPSDEPITTDPMRPIPEEVRRILYNGISHNGEGRCQYLSERYKQQPKARYYFQESNNWEYGWRVDTVDLLSETRLSRPGIIHDSFYRRNGVAPDPEYYRTPIKANAPWPMPLL